MSKSQGGSPEPLRGDNFTVEEIWKMSQRSNQVWGLEHYEVPVIHHDPVKMRKAEELYKQATGKGAKKAPGKLDMNAKRGGAFTQITKHSLAVPAPWNYQISCKWITGYQNMKLGDITPRAQRKLMYKWLATPADQQNFDRQAPAKGGKLALDAKKNTFIDQIIHFNTKKSYPLPSPCSYYLDEKLAKKFYGGDNMDIMYTKPRQDTKKTNLPRAERKFILVNRGAEKLPAPDLYNPKEPMTDCQKKIFKKDEFLSYKKYKDKLGEIAKRHKEVKDRDDGRHQEIVGKLKEGILVKNPRPLPVDLMTFDKISIYKDIQPGKAMKKKGNGFGTQDRFERDELMKWKTKMEAYNKGVTDGKTIDLKKDPTPGPAHYSLIASWPGKKLKEKKKKDDDGDKKLPNIFKSMSTGPKISLYYRNGY